MSQLSQDPYVALAQRVVETYVTTHQAPVIPADLPDEMLHERAGVFVSLHKNGDLRGCIGTIAPTCKNIAEEIVQNGISSCSRDYRFYPVEPEELDELDYSVDVLMPPEPVSSLSELDHIRYGVIVTKASRRGLLLPDLEGVDSPEMQIAIAKQKAGISLDEEGVALERFEVIRHHM